MLHHITIWWFSDTPQIIHFNRNVHCKPSILDTPSMETPIYDPPDP